jgi:hypothetical protein
VFASGVDAGFGESWLGATSFSLQAYCDFAGYSLCAIGVALMFGFRFPMNFESPFGSVGMAELWTRWHMSLASWIRDYVFLPLGGYRRGRLRGEANLLFAFLLVGLWHGAAWTFVVWGGLQGVFICAEHLVKRYVWDFGKVDNRFGRAALAVATFGMFSIAAVFFRAHSFGQGTSILASMFAPGGHSTLVPFSEAIVALVLGACVVGSHILFGHCAVGTGSIACPSRRARLRSRWRWPPSCSHPDSIRRSSISVLTMNRQWLHAWVAALLVCALLAVGYEWLLRQRGYLVTVQDDADLWSMQLDRIRNSRARWRCWGVAHRVRRRSGAAFAPARRPAGRDARGQRQISACGAARTGRRPVVHRPRDRRRRCTRHATPALGYAAELFRPLPPSLDLSRWIHRKLLTALQENLCSSDRRSRRPTSSSAGSPARGLR